jgi:hypothetical protein
LDRNVQTGETQALVADGVEWQCAHLLKRNDQSSDTRVIAIAVQACQQQTGMSECGPFTIANACAVAFGHDPAKIKYTGNLRRQFLDMLHKGSLEMFTYRDRMWNEPSFRKFGKNKKNVVSDWVRNHYVDLVCHCQQPEGISEIIYCDNRDCNKACHYSCYMIGKFEDKGPNEAHVAQREDFECYECRAPGDYKFMSLPILSDLTAIVDLPAKLKNITGVKVQKAICNAKSFRKQGPAHLFYYRVMQEIVIRYDLNTVAKKEGEIYGTLEEICNAQNLKWPFDTLTSAELVHIAVSLICSVEGKICPPLWDHDMDEIDLTVPLKESIQSNKPWLLTVEQECDKAKRLLQQMKKSKQSYRENQDNISNMQRHFRDIEYYACKAQNALEGADDSNGTSYQKKSKKKLLNQIQKLRKDRTQMLKEYETLDFFVTDDSSEEDEPK